MKKPGITGFHSKRAETNDVWIVSVCPPDESRVCYWLTEKGQGECHSQTLKNSVIFHVKKSKQGLYMKPTGNPAALIDKRRRKMELTQSWSRMKFDILTVIQLISHLTHIFSYLWKNYAHSATVLMTLLQKEILLLCF